MKELIQKLKERKANLENWIKGPFEYEGSDDYATAGLVDSGRCEEMADEIRFLADVLAEFDRE